MLDVDDKKHIDDVGKHDLIGQLECSLADLVTAGQQYKRTLRKAGIPCRVMDILPLYYPWQGEVHAAQCMAYSYGQELVVYCTMAEYQFYPTIVS